MKRYIKEKNKLCDDLTNQIINNYNIFISTYRKTEEELKEGITNKIVRDRFLQYQERVNYSEMEKNINLQNKKSKEFQLIQKKRVCNYDVRTCIFLSTCIFS
jgi:hypothetical protein